MTTPLPVRINNTRYFNMKPIKDLINNWIDKEIKSVKNRINKMTIEEAESGQYELGLALIQKFKTLYK